MVIGPDHRQATTLSATITAGTNVVYAWAFGDGDTGSGAVAQHTYPSVGIYTAVVTASNSTNWMTATTTVTVQEAISGLLAYNDSPTEFGDLTTLWATVSAGTSVAYQWDFDDDSSGSGSPVTHTYTSLGTYTAVVTASNGVSQDVVTTTVVITDAPISGLTAVNDSPTVLNQTTHLTATVVKGTNVSYAWDLDDGSSANTQTVSHVYPSTGLFQAVVTATNSRNFMTYTTQVIVDVPIAGLSADNDSPTWLGEVTHLTATVTAGSYVQYEWDLGDGTGGFGAQVAHIYPAPDVYTAMVTAENSVSAMTDSTQVTVYGVDFVGSPLFGSAPLTVSFSSQVHLTSTVSYLWRFGDGGSSTAQHPTHGYASTGWYTVSLQAGNGFVTDTMTKTNYIAVGVARIIAYTYDDLYRLTEADYSSGETFQYAYDQVSNLTAVTTTITSTIVSTREYDLANRVITITTGGEIRTLDWSNVGELLRDGNDTYEWDAAGRLISATVDRLTSRYAYLGDGSRISMTVGSETTTYTLDLAAPLVQVLVANDARGSTAYLYGVTRIGEDDGVRLYHLADHLGSVRALVNPNGNVQGTRDYQPYGLPLDESGTATSIYGFTGEQTDTTGLIYLRARTLDPAQGRFLSKDPWDGDEESPLTQNRFLYALGNPMRWVDPAGLVPVYDALPPSCDPPCSIHPVVTFIVQRMRIDAASEVIVKIRKQNETHLYEDSWVECQRMPWWLRFLLCPGLLEAAHDADTAAHQAALTRFGCLVADASLRPFCGQWDYKRDIANTWDEAQKIDFCSLGYREAVDFYYDIWANFHFGYVGTAGGFSEVTLLSGAVLEHLVKHPGQIEDDPSDQAAIAIGVDLFWNTLNERSLLRQLFLNRGKLNKAIVKDGKIIEVYR